ncbi:MAG: DNA-processing protein DprA [Actinoallomurus sp.]
MNTILTSDTERAARARLTTITDAADPILAGLLREHTATEVIAMIQRRARHDDGPMDTVPSAALRNRLTYWAQRSTEEPEPDLPTFTDTGGQFLVPGDYGYPEGLYDLDTHPCGLWTRGRLRLADAALSTPVAILGSTAASPTSLTAGYAAGIARELASTGWGILTDAGPGIASAVSHAMLAGGATAAVLSCGLDTIDSSVRPRLVRRIIDHGVVATELPADATPTPVSELARARILAAWPVAVILTEAPEGDPALEIARRAAELDRPVMVMRSRHPSRASAGGDRLVTEGIAAAVTTAKEVIARLPDMYP